MCTPTLVSTLLTNTLFNGLNVYSGLYENEGYWYIHMFLQDANDHAELATFDSQGRTDIHGKFAFYTWESAATRRDQLCRWILDSDGNIKVIFNLDANVDLSSSITLNGRTYKRA
jgi:hypothetical protein